MIRFRIKRESDENVIIFYKFDIKRKEKSEMEEIFCSWKRRSEKELHIEENAFFLLRNELNDYPLLSERENAKINYKIEKKKEEENNK